MILTPYRMSIYARLLSYAHSRSEFDCLSESAIDTVKKQVFNLFDKEILNKNLFKTFKPASDGLRAKLKVLNHKLIIFVPDEKCAWNTSQIDSSNAEAYLTYFESKNSCKLIKKSNEKTVLKWHFLDNDCEVLCLPISSFYSLPDNLFPNIIAIYLSDPEVQLDYLDKTLSKYAKTSNKYFYIRKDSNTANTHTKIYYREFINTDPNLIAKNFWTMIGQKLASNDQ